MRSARSILIPFEDVNNFFKPRLSISVESSQKNVDTHNKIYTLYRFCKIKSFCKFRDLDKGDEHPQVSPSSYLYTNIPKLRLI